MDDTTFLLTVVIIAIALVFDYVNGFHDAANSIATVVSTRVLTPLQGVAWAAFWNFIAAFTFGTAVAQTVAADSLTSLRWIPMSFSPHFAARLFGISLPGMWGYRPVRPMR